jgi:hypothetical protein
MSSGSRQRAGNPYRIIGGMARFDLYLKVEVDTNGKEDPRKLAAELCRLLRKAYGVREAELTNWVDRAAGGEE